MAVCVGSVGSQRAEGEDGGGGKKVQVWLAFRVGDVSKDQMFLVSIVRGLLKAHLIPGFKLRKSLRYIFTSWISQPNRLTSHNLCPHMAKIGNCLHKFMCSVQTSCELHGVHNEDLFICGYNIR